MKNPSQTCLQTLRLIAELTWQMGYPPTYRELACRARISYAGMRFRLLRLANMKLVRIDAGIARGLTLTDSGLAALAWDPPLYVVRSAS